MQRETAAGATQGEALPICTSTLQALVAVACPIRYQHRNVKLLAAPASLPGCPCHIAKWTHPSKRWQHGRSSRPSRSGVVSFRISCLPVLEHRPPVMRMMQPHKRKSLPVGDHLEGKAVIAPRSLWPDFPLPAGERGWRGEWTPRPASPGSQQRSPPFSSFACRLSSRDGGQAQRRHSRKFEGGKSYLGKGGGAPHRRRLP